AVCVGNRTDWRAVTRPGFSLATLFGGNSTLAEARAATIGPMRLELPPEYRGNIGYVTDGWSARGDVGHGLLGMTVHAGVERHLTRVALRGGVRCSFEQWDLRGGLGFARTDRVGLAVA